MYSVSGTIFDNGYEQEIEEAFDTLDEALNSMNYYDRPFGLIVTDQHGNILAER